MKLLLSYNPATGIFQRPNGSRAGCEGARGYRRISLNNIRLSENRLAWRLVYGFVSDRMVIDHKNCDPRDNWIENLQAVTFSENIQLGTGRLMSGNKSGHTGVFLHKATGHYYAEVFSGGKRVWRKSFKNKEDAISARAEKMEEYGKTTRRP